MVDGDIKSGKIMEFGFNFRGLDGHKTHLLKDRDDLLHGLGQNMRMPQSLAGAGQGNIHVFLMCFGSVYLPGFFRDQAFNQSSLDHWPLCRWLLCQQAGPVPKEAKTAATMPFLPKYLRRKASNACGLPIDLGFGLGLMLNFLKIPLHVYSPNEKCPAF